MPFHISLYLFGPSVRRNITRLPVPIWIIFCFFTSTYITERVLEGCCFLSNMKKIVLKASIGDEKCKKRVVQTVAGVEGVESVAMDMKEMKITVIGEADPVDVATKLRKFGYAELLSVGPAKEEKKAEGEKKKDGGKKEEKKKAEPPKIVYLYPSSYGPYSYSC
jgi:hypothetical protein